MKRFANECLVTTAGFITDYTEDNFYAKFKMITV